MHGYCVPLCVVHGGGVRCWDSDAQWIRHFFGADSPILDVTGSLKCDGLAREPSRPQSVQFRRQFGFRPDEPVLVAGSTHDEEELWLAEIVRTIAAEFPQIRLVVVPRYVWRCGDVELRLREQGFDVVVSSRLPSTSPTSAMVTLVDSTGSLRDIWGIAQFAYVGGSLVQRGGHNMVEPASYGIPVCFGPFVADFQSLAEELVAAGGAVQVASRACLTELIRSWMRNPSQASKVGSLAQAYVVSKTDSQDRTVKGLLSTLPVPASPPVRSGVSIQRTREVGEECATDELRVRQISEAS